MSDTIEPTKHYQQLKSLISIDGLDFDPARSANLYQVNFISRVFSYLVGKFENTYKILCCSHRGFLRVQDHNTLSKPVSSGIIPLTGTYVLYGSSYGFEIVKVRAAGDDVWIQFMNFDGFLTGEICIANGETIIFDLVKRGYGYSTKSNTGIASNLIVTILEN